MLTVLIILFAVVGIGSIFMYRAVRKGEKKNGAVPDATPAVPPSVDYTTPWNRMPPAAWNRKPHQSSQPVTPPQPQPSSNDDDMLDTMLKVDLAESVIDAVIDTPSSDSPSSDSGSSDFGGFDGGSSDGGGASGSW